MCIATLNVPAVEAARGCADAAPVERLLDSIAAIFERVISEGREPRLSLYDAQVAPGIPIKTYVRRWLDGSHCDTEALVLAVIYVDRLCLHTRLTITRNNVHRILLAALTVATKSCTERALPNSLYASVGGVCVSELNRLERTFLTDTDWRIFVSGETFSSYYSCLTPASKLDT
ncbi:Nuc-1 negative regulatory protein preg [Diplonema papillatum]|nr:Nuc-1 negative regulatory protein preg [Diplonema papillatum]